MNGYVYRGGELYHFGVKGMKWGVRRAVQTATGGIRRGINQASAHGVRRANHNTSGNYRHSIKQSPTQKELTPQQKAARRKKALKIGAAAAATVLAVYGTMKLNKALSEFNAKNHAKTIARINRAHDLSYQRYWLSQQR